MDDDEWMSLDDDSEEAAFENIIRELHQAELLRRGSDQGASGGASNDQAGPSRPPQAGPSGLGNNLNMVELVDRDVNILEDDTDDDIIELVPPVRPPKGSATATPGLPPPLHLRTQDDMRMRIGSRMYHFSRFRNGPGGTSRDSNGGASASAFFRAAAAPKQSEPTPLQLSQDHHQDIGTVNVSEPQQQFIHVVSKSLRPTAKKPVAKKVTVVAQPPALPLRLEPADELSVRIGHYYLNEEQSDICFLLPKINIAGDDAGVQRVPAHKFVLAARSEVFKAMFFGLLAESRPEIELPDMEHKGFVTMLKYMYTDKVELEADSIVSTMYSAKKYCVDMLEKACDQFMARNLTAENVLLILSQALLFDSDVIELCWLKVDEWTVQIIVSESFQNVDKTVLTLFLQRETLSVDELSLFRAVLRWSKAECGRQNLSDSPENIRSVLGEALYLIRFPAIEGEGFAFDEDVANVLNQDDYAAVFNFFAEPQKTVVPFPTTPRDSFVQPVPKMPLEVDDDQRELIISRFPKMAEGKGKHCMFDEAHQVDFTVSQSILITGLGVYGTRCPEGERSIYVELLAGESGLPLADGHLRVSCTGKAKIHQIRFKTPFAVQPESIYTASAKFDNNYPYPTHYGINGQRHVSVVYGPLDKRERVTFLFFKTERLNPDTGGEKGQIPQILFQAIASPVPTLVV